MSENFNWKSSSLDLFKLLLTMIDYGTNDKHTYYNNSIYNKDIYNYHMEKFREINIEYRVALEELIREYADELKSINGISATVNFLTNVVNITQPIGEVSCECNVEE